MSCHPNRILRRSYVVSASKLAHVDFVFIRQSEESLVLLLSRRISGYRIRPIANIISLLGQSQTDLAVEIVSLSPEVLEIPACIIFALLPVVLGKINLFPGWVVLRMDVGVRRVNQGMLYVVRREISSKMRGINLQSWPQSCIVNIWGRPLMALITERLEGIVVLNINHRVIWEGVWSPIPRLNGNVRWGWKMVHLIL